MEYKQIILDGYKGRETTSYVSFFKQQAQIHKRDNFVEFAGFFNGCKIVINQYKDEIKRRYYEKLHENDFVLNSISLGNGVNYNGIIVTDQNDERIKDTIQHLKEQKQHVEEQGYQNSSYGCRLTAAGEITEDVFQIEYTFTYLCLIEIEKAIQQAKDELTTPQPPITKQPKEEINKGNTEKPQQYTLNKKQETNVLKNYDFWDSVDITQRGTHNIFKNKTRQDFLNMVCTADFSKIHKRPIQHRVRYNIVVLGRIMGDDWLKIAVKNIGQKDKDTCASRTDFEEFAKLKNMYLQ